MDISFPNYDSLEIPVLTVCAGDQISLQCSHDNYVSGITRWIFSHPVNCLRLIDHNNPGTARLCDPFTFHNITDISSGGLLNSIAVTVANGSISSTVIECRDSAGSQFNQIGNTTLCVIGIQ